jgi:hypothetical protein
MQYQEHNDIYNILIQHQITAFFRYVDDTLIIAMMEAARASETSVENYFTRQYIPEDKSEHHKRSRKADVWYIHETYRN